MSDPKVNTINLFDSHTESEKNINNEKHELTDDTKQINAFGQPENTGNQVSAANTGSAGNQQVSGNGSSNAEVAMDIFMSAPNRRTRVSNKLQSDVNHAQSEHLKVMGKKKEIPNVEDTDMALDSFIGDTEKPKAKPAEKSERPTAEPTREPAEKRERPTAEPTREPAEKRTAEPTRKQGRPKQFISDDENEPDMVDELYAKATNVIKKAESVTRKATLKAGVSLKEKLITKLQLSSVDKMFKDSGVIKTNVMHFRQAHDSIMAYKYTGSNTVIRIPAFVNQMPVEYIHTKFFQRLAIVSNTSKVVSDFRSGTMVDADVKDYQYKTSRITKVVLPETLKVIPDDLFCWCASLKELVVPKSVRVMSVDAIANSGVRTLIFNGPCPMGFSAGSLPKEITVYVKPEYAETFRR